LFFILTFPVECGLQAGSLGKDHVTSTNPAKELGALLNQAMNANFAHIQKLV
jgi:hypothetical protein